MKILYESDRDCNGCGACFAACPVNCISFGVNEEGFEYPIVDGTKCIDCGLCERVCPQKGQYTHNESASFMAASSKDASINNSSSGGIFPLVAECIIKQGGVVFGTTLDEKHIAYQKSIDKVEEIAELQGSKYVFSSSRNTFKETEKFLDLGRPVLYVGRPCQIAGLKNYLKKEYENLYTMDFICHGVPSSKMFLAYIAYLEKKHGGKLIDINFRNKEKYGWSITLSYDISYQNGKVKRYYLPQRISEYFTGFLTGAILREACYDCKFSQINHLSDITLGDYWGYDKQDIEFDVSKGLSLVICNTEKGRQLLESIKDRVHITDIAKDKVVGDNKNLIHSTNRMECRDTIYKELEKEGFSSIGKKYLRSPNYKKEYMKAKLPVNLLRITQNLLGKMRKRTR